MIITVKVFAGLKKYFEQQFNLEGDETLDVLEVIEMLGVIRPDSMPLLSACRFAVAEEFVPTTYQLKNGEELYLIPPSSGG